MVSITAHFTAVWSSAVTRSIIEDGFSFLPALIMDGDWYDWQDEDRSRAADQTHNPGHYPGATVTGASAEAAAVSIASAVNTSTTTTTTVLPSVFPSGPGVVWQLRIRVYDQCGITTIYTDQFIQSSSDTQKPCCLPGQFQCSVSGNPCDLTQAHGALPLRVYIYCLRYTPFRTLTGISGPPRCDAPLPRASKLSTSARRHRRHRLRHPHRRTPSA